MPSRLAAVLVLSLLVAPLMACSTPSAVAGGHLSVVAGESPWGAVARAIGGNEVHVVSILSNPATDPHEYTPTAAVAAEVATADVVIENGLGYDAFLSGLVATGAAHARSVLIAAQVLGVSGPDANPHLWYAIQRVPVMARAIAAAFVAADPARASTYRENLSTFLTSLQPLDAQITDIAQHHGGAKVAQTERVAGYLLAEAHLDVVSPLGYSLAIESGQEPNAADTETMTKLLTPGQLAAVIFNTQTQSKATDLVQTQAKAASIPLVPVSEIVEPVGASYVAWQGRQLQELSAALARSSS